MTGREQGFLLLTSHLGIPDRPVLTLSQFRLLARRVRQMERPAENRHLCLQDLISLGYEPAMAWRILGLLEDKSLLFSYLRQAQRSGCIPITRVTQSYPASVRSKLGLDAPGCLWARGDLSLLTLPAAALVGSRELLEPNARFAREVGRQAAAQGYVLVSGNARGADQTAQSACISSGGRVISVVADALWRAPDIPGVLYLSEDGFDEGFSAPRALSRNRIIHCLGNLTFVAQARYGRGGTWDGTVHNLKNGWSPVFCCPDGSRGTEGLVSRGAALAEDLSDFASLAENNKKIQLEDFL